MVYPPALPPATRSDITVAAGAHADDHNKIALALAAFLDELGPDLAGSYANLTTRLLGVAAGQDQAAIDAFLANRTAAEAARAAAEALVLSDLGTTDGQTRALVQNPASQTALALSASTGEQLETPGTPARAAADSLYEVAVTPTRAALLGTTTRLMVGIGDSTMRGGTDTPGVAGATTVHVDGAWLQAACWILQQGITFGRNAGITGNTLAQMNARYAADVAALTPDLVPILGGRNDVQYDWTSLAAMQAKYAALVAKVLATDNASGGKAVPIIVTCLPTDDPTFAARLVAFNAWLRDYARTEGIFLVDFEAIARNPDTGTYWPVFGVTDGTHPGYRGHLILGKYFADQMRGFVSARPPRTAYVGEGAANLWNDQPLFDGAVAANGLVTSHGIVRSTSGTTFQVLKDPAVPGNVQRVTIPHVGADTTGDENSVQTGRGFGSDISPGDDISASGYLTTRGAAMNVSVSLRDGGASAPRTVMHSQPGQEFTAARWYHRFTVAAGAVQIQLFHIASAGPGSFEFGGMSLYNHTKGAYLL